MKHIIFSLVILVLLSSCEPWSTREINNHYIVNQTDKEIVHVLYSADSIFINDEKLDSLVFHVSAKCDTTLEWTVSAITGITSQHGYLCYNDGFSVYNITDTTSIFWKNIWGGYEYDKDPIPEIFRRSNGKDERDVTNKESIWVINYYLTVNDQLLSLMQKDYTMLERFKEYYQK